MNRTRPTLALLALLATAVVVLAAGPSASALDINQEVTMPDAEVGTEYEFEFESEEGCVPYRYSFSSGTLPPGLSVDPKGFLRGVPTATGSYTFYVAVDDSVDCQSPQSQGEFTLEVRADLAVVTDEVTPPTVGVPYLFQLVGKGMEQGIFTRWRVANGQLPPGLAVSSTGLISGTPTVAGRWGITILFEEPFMRSGEADLVFDIADKLTVQSVEPPASEVGVAVAVKPRTSGGHQPLAWKVASGSLPAGVSLDAKTGAVTGTPSAAGSFSAVLEASDDGGNAARTTLALTVAPKLKVRTARLASGTAGSPYAVTLATSGGSGAVTWRVSGGKLPAGLALDAKTGKISGTPARAGKATFTVRASDALRAKAVRTLTLTVS